MVNPANGVLWKKSNNTVKQECVLQLLYEMEEDLALVNKLRESLEDSIAKYEGEMGEALPGDVKSDIRLARFLNAFDHNVEEAANAYRSMLVWRKEAKVDELRKNQINVDVFKQESFPHAELVRSIGEYGPWYVSGTSYGGDLVHLEIIGKTDPSLLFEKIPEQKILEHQIGFFETRGKILDELSTARAKLVRTIQIRDLSCFSLALLQHASALSTLSKIMKAGTQNWPESTSKAIFINTPVSFYAVWKTLSVMLRKKTVNKVMFLKSDYHRELLKFVPPKVIHRLEKMRKLENHEFVGNEDLDHHPLKHSHEVVVPAGGTKYYPMWITKEGHRSKVKFRVGKPQGQDTIPPFTLTFLTSRGEPDGTHEGIVIEMPLQPTPCPDQGGEGVYETEFPHGLPEEIESGFVLVEFDNSQSWVYSITVPLQYEAIGPSNNPPTESFDDEQS